jgi:hypothetical protein
MMNVMPIPIPQPSAKPPHELSSVVVPLLKGVLYQEENPGRVGLAAESAGGVRDYVAVLWVWS